MKSVLAAALAGALAVQLAYCSGCASVPPVAEHVQAASTDARAVLQKALVMAEDAVAVTRFICSIDETSKPCQVLVIALTHFYDAAVVAEDALNRGDTVDMAALEAQIRQILAYAQNVSRSIA